MSDLIMLGGLWLNESSSREMYLSGRLGLGGKILIFKNRKKRGENDPDYYMMLAPWESGQKSEEGENDDIPF